jgi:DNA-binding response OmpR family regulator
MRSLKILVADDSRTVRTQLRRALTAAGYTVLEASDGVEAVELASRELPDLAILDIVMPQADGFAVCQRLKQMGAPLNGMPIVFVTRFGSRALELLGDQWGAYVEKPVSEAALLDIVGALVPKE